MSTSKPELSEIAGISQAMQRDDVLEKKIEQVMQERGLFKKKLDNQLQQTESLHPAEAKIERLMINKVSIENENAAKAKFTEEGTALVEQLQRSQTELEHALQGNFIEFICKDKLKTIQECVRDVKRQLQEGKGNYIKSKSTVYTLDVNANTLKQKLSDTNEKLRETEIELLEKQTILDDDAIQYQNQEEVMNNNSEEINRLMFVNRQLEKNFNEMKEQLNGLNEEQIVLVGNLKELEENLDRDIDYIHRLEENMSELTKCADNILKAAQKLLCRVSDIELLITQKNGVIAELEREKREMDLLIDEMALQIQQLEKPFMIDEEKVDKLAKFKDELIESCTENLRLEISEFRDSNVCMKTDLDRLSANLEWCKTMDKMLKDESEIEKKFRAEKEENIKWKMMFDLLQAEVELHPEQLDVLEVENSAAYDEVTKTSKQYVALFEHQYPKPKIHYVVKLKKDNFFLEMELSKSREQILKLQKKIGRLEDQAFVHKEKRINFYMTKLTVAL